MPDLFGKTVVVVGASRGFGRGVAEAFAGTGAAVIGVARTRAALDELAAAQSRTVGVVADAVDPATSSAVIAEHDPDVLVLVAGATPPIAEFHEQTWAEFSTNWNTDVRLTHLWLREALIRPLRPGSRVIVISSGAALAGSPLSGGYAGAKSTQRFITAYAQEVSARAGLELTFTAVLPRISPLTDLGRAAVAAYAARSGMSETEYTAQFGVPLSPATVGVELVDLATREPASVGLSYLLTSAGLQPLP